MLAYEAADRWKVHAPAKLNLTLEVLNKRSDGYHEIETLMVPITLGDTLYLTPHSADSLELTCQWSVPLSGSAPLPTDDRNLVIRAIQLLRARYNVSSGAKIDLFKRIPSEAGLGGGSSDAAAALVAANAAWKLNLPREALAEIGAQVGSDVPFFLFDGPAICRGRGEKIERLNTAARLDIVLVKPPLALATKDVYKAGRPAEKPRTSELVAKALASGDRAAIGRELFNRLEEGASKITDWISSASKIFRDLGCVGRQMSGSGSSYFGICRSARHAMHVAGRLRALRLGAVYQASTGFAF